jgi:hypothetical protein
MVESNKPAILDGLLFTRIFETFRIAIQPTKLIVSFAAIVVICGVGKVMDVSRTVMKADASRMTELHIYVADPDSLPEYIKSNSQNEYRAGVFSTLWHFGSARFNMSLRSLFRFDLPAVAENIAECFRALEWAVRYHPLYSAALFAVTLAVMSVAGGAVCRVAALQFARGEKPGLTDAMLFSTRKFGGFFTAPLVPVGIIIFMGLFISLLGLVGNIAFVGELLIGLGMPLTLFVGALMTVVAIGAVAGFNLMFPTIAYEDSDSFDAMSRSFSYVYSKPWHMGFYTAVAAVYGAICYLFVRLFAFLAMWISRVFLEVGVLSGNSKLTTIWPEPTFTDLLGMPVYAGESWSLVAAGVLVRLFTVAVVGLLASFLISFFFCANTIVYALMRKTVDNTALQDVSVDTASG